MKTIDDYKPNAKVMVLIDRIIADRENADDYAYAFAIELKRALPLASLLPAAVKALEYYANPDTHWRSGFMPKTFEATGADAGEMARSTLTAISEATKAVEGN